MDEFVGRAAELSRLHAELEQAKAGVPRTVLVEGPPGIGKSSLVHHFVAQADVASVLRASGDEHETRLSCGLVGQLFADAGWPETGDNRCGDPLAVGGELLRLLGELDGRGPVLLVVDDAQWADPHSLQAVTFALRRLQVDPVLAVFTARDDGGVHPEGLRRLAFEKGCALRLAGLGCQELGELAERLGTGPLPQRALEHLREHTAGIPLHARALLEELPPHVLARADGSLPAPRSFSLLVLSRLAGCSRAATRLVEAASVLGLRSELGLVARMVDLDEPAGAVDEAVAAGLLEVRETPAAVTVSFPHAMVRAAVHDTLGRARRSELHAAAAHLLDGRHALEHRAAAAVGHDPGVAGELAAHARAESDQGDPLSAAGHLLTAARLQPDRAQRERHLLDAAQLLLTGGDVVRVAGMADQLAELSDTARRRYVLGHLALATGRQRQAEDLLRAAWVGADPTAEPEVRVMASEQLAELYSAQIQPDEAITWARRALEHDVGEHLGASALTTLVLHLALVGRPGEALPLVEPMRVDAVSPSPRAVSGVLARGVVRMWIGELRPSYSDLDSVLAGTGMAVASRPRLNALGFLAQVEHLLGRWADSIRHVTTAVSLAADGGQTSLLPFLHATAVRALAARGDWQRAEAHLQSAADTAQVLGDALSMAYAYDAEARLASCHEQPQRVVDACTRISALPGQAVIAEPGVLAWRELYADALMSLRRIDEAAKVVADLEQHLTDRPRRRVAIAALARLQGSLRAAQGDLAAARRSFEEGLRVHETLEAPFERALVQLAYGRVLRRAGERRDASAHLRAAGRTFSGLEARPFSESADRELGACGLTPRHRGVAPQVELTPQELAVATLVGEGRTNREVAEALIVSPKTVDYHLGNIFTKLGIRSRRQLRERLVDRVQ